jgi:hypothetical protein
MKGESSKHQAEVLLSQFATVIAHCCDPTSARWLGAKLGRRIQTVYSGSSSPNPHGTAWDAMFGQQHTSSSFSEHYEAVLQDQEFMTGRTGGPEHGFVCDAVVVKSGMPFADGESFKRVAFSQRG